MNTPKTRTLLLAGVAVVGAAAAYIWYINQKKAHVMISKPLWFDSDSVDTTDPHTQSNFQELRLDHLHLSLRVDFKVNKLIGFVDVTGTSRCENVNKVVLDSRSLNIKKAEDAKSGKDLPFSLTDHPTNPSCFGSALAIILEEPLPANTSTTIRIYYETTEQSEAVQWLAPEQTSGKKKPFLFTQCQAIHARSLLPCQDIPRSKCPYSADITVENPLSALMSAILTNKGIKTAANGVKEMQYSFTQELPIPSYLIALAVGMLEPRKIGPRSMVWAEKEVVDAAAYEFGETEAFLATAEDICGVPYVWKRYDVLVLPPSFPYGGMENPCLTFATPTLLAGDRSLAGVVAHEIAHSWTGNLVTNKSWEHFWLNEGCTVFVERKIMQKREGKTARACQSIVGYEHLKDDVEHMGEESPLTNLVPNLQGIDPDDAFSSVPYEKGYSLLSHLEEAIGEELFGEFFRSYIRHFQSKTLTTMDFIRFFERFTSDKGLPVSIDWHAWTCTPGMPHRVVAYDRTNHNTASALVEEWVGVSTLSGDAQAAAASVVCAKPGFEWSSWSAVHMKVPFLDFLLAHVKTKGLFCTETLKLLDHSYNLTPTQNSEIRFRWQRICLQCNYRPILQHVVQFITTQGRMKFVRPLYRELVKVEPALARSTFEKHKGSYHPIAAKMLGQDLSK